MTVASEDFIKFPVVWTYRIICENTGSVKNEVQNLLNSLNIGNLQEGNISSSEKFITLKISYEAKTREELHKLPNLLSKIKGVFQVL